MTAPAARPATSIDVNCDMGESFGRWRLGDDAGVVPFVTSVNIAAGYHAGDPPTIRRTVDLAAAAGCRLGAHIALPDLMGFGRRPMQIPVSDLRDYCLYQIAAVDGFVRAAGQRLTHVKPHGSLYGQVARSPEVAAAVADAMASYDPELRLFMLDQTCAAVVADAGVNVIFEAFPDLDYTADGDLVIEPEKRPWDPDLVAGRAVTIALEGTVTTQDRQAQHPLVDIGTLCLHGDAPNAADIAERTYNALLGAGIHLEPYQ